MILNKVKSTDAYFYIFGLRLQKFSIFKNFGTNIKRIIFNFLILIQKALRKRAKNVKSVFVKKLFYIRRRLCIDSDCLGPIIYSEIV